MGGVGLGEAAGDLDDGADVFGGGGGEREEGSEGDAEEGDAVGVDAGAGGDVGDGVGDGLEPEGDVVAIVDDGGVGEAGSGAVEVVDGVAGDADAGEHGAELFEPEAYVAAGSMDEEDGGEGAGAGGLDLLDTDWGSAAGKGAHGG